MKLFLLLSVIVIGQCADPTPCCLSNKFTAQMMRIEARLQTGATDPKIDDVYYTIDYDAHQAREVNTGYVLNATTGIRTPYTEYKDYTMNKRYTVDSSGCMIEDLNELMIQPCMAANFSLERRYRIGSGKHAVNVTSWEGQYLGTLWLNIHFIDDGHCTPMALNIYGPTPDNAAQLLYTYIFSDVQLNQLSSPDPFILPKSCGHVPLNMFAWAKYSRFNKWASKGIGKGVLDVQGKPRWSNQKIWEFSVPERQLRREYIAEVNHLSETKALLIKLLSLNYVFYLAE